MSLKTFVKWPGNKSKYMKYIVPNVPEEFNRYIEPFVGSGALLLKLKPTKWIINDLNKDLINCWKHVMNDPEHIIAGFKKFGKKFKRLSLEKKKEMCKKLTAGISSMDYDINRAIRFLLMKYCAYMGNISIKNENKFSGLDSNIYVKNRCFFLEPNSFKNLLDVSEFLNTTKGKIYNLDYKKILSKAKIGDFVFLDPPYIEDHDYDFDYNNDHKTEKTDSFLKSLRDELKKLDKKGVKWMMTQAETPEVKRIFSGYKIIKFKVYRYFSNTYKNELIIKNFTE